MSGAGLSGLPPQVDLANEEKLMEFFQQPGVVSAAHDVFAKLEVGATREQHEMLLSVAPLIGSHIYLP